MPLPADLALTLTPLAAGLTLDALWMGPQSVGGGRRVRLARRLLAIRTLAPWVRWAEPRLAELWDTDAFLGHRIPSRRS